MRTDRSRCSMSSNSGGEGAIRAQLVEADLVQCMIALPTQLFRSTGIPVCVWFLAKDKTPGRGGVADRRGEVLFIDARNMGYMVDRAERASSDEGRTAIGRYWTEDGGAPLTVRVLHRAAGSGWELASIRVERQPLIRGSGR